MAIGGFFAAVQSWDLLPAAVYQRGDGSGVGAWIREGRAERVGGHTRTLAELQAMLKQCGEDLACCSAGI